jgi:hypothetical protein
MPAGHKCGPILSVTTDRIHQRERLERECLNPKGKIPLKRFVEREERIGRRINRGTKVLEIAFTFLPKSVIEPINIDDYETFCRIVSKRRRLGLLMGYENPLAIEPMRQRISKTLVQEIAKGSMRPIGI